MKIQLERDKVLPEQVDEQKNRTRAASKFWAYSAAALAGSALVNYLKTRRVERANPPIGEFVDVDGVRLHYLVRGQGQAVVLLHTSGSLIQDFVTSGLVDTIARNYRVIVFDRPGFGYSSRPRNVIWTPHAQAHLLRHAMDKIGVTSPIVVGHGWGTLVAVALGLDYPDDVKSLVLASGSYYPDPGVSLPLLATMGLPIVGDLFANTLSPHIARGLWPTRKRRLFAPRWTPTRFDQEFPFDMIFRPTQLRASSAESAMLPQVTHLMQARYHELLMPVVILAGDADRYVNMPTQSARLREALPHAHLKLAHGVGHMLHHAAQAQVISAIEEAATSVGAVQANDLFNRPMLSQLKH